MKAPELTKSICIYLFLIGFTAFNKSQTLSKETVIIETDFGNIRIKLYEETPLHKANFLKLVQSGFYDSLLFHRVINGFMIQGGDPNSRHAKYGDTLGDNDLDYTVPAEFNRKLIHKKGALAAARESDDKNPEFASSACQFYLVQGKVRTKEELEKIENRINNTRYSNSARQFMQTDTGKAMKKQYNLYKSANQSDSAAIVQAQIDSLINRIAFPKGKYKFNDEEIATYTSIGGTPHLDGAYTVFGIVIDGLRVIDKIAEQKTNAMNRPEKDIRMKIRVK